MTTHLETIRRYFDQLGDRLPATSTTPEVVALANAGTTQSDGEERAIAAWRRNAGRATLPPNAVFWHRQSHRRAFASDGALKAALVLHWMGDRRVIEAALAPLTALLPHVELMVPEKDHLAFVLRPLAPQRAAAGTADVAVAVAAGVGDPAPAKAKRPSAPKKSDPLPPPHDHAAVKARLFASKLRDVPRVHTWLREVIANSDTPQIARALQVLVAFDLAKSTPAPGVASAFADGMLEALAPHLAALAPVVDEGNHVAVQVVLGKLLQRGGEDPTVLATCRAFADSASWWARAALAKAGLHCPLAARGEFDQLLRRLAVDARDDVSHAALQTIAALSGEPIAAIWTNYLEDQAAPSALRARLVTELSYHKAEALAAFAPRLRAQLATLAVENVSDAETRRRLAAKLA